MQLKRDKKRIVVWTELKTKPSTKLQHQWSFLAQSSTEPDRLELELVCVCVCLWYALQEVSPVVPGSIRTGDCALDTSHPCYTNTQLIPLMGERHEASLTNEVQRCEHRKVIAKSMTTGDGLGFFKHTLPGIVSYKCYHSRKDKGAYWLGDCHNRCGWTCQEGLMTYGQDVTESDISRIFKNAS